VPSKRNHFSPYELWFKRKPNINYFKLWGCLAYVRLPDIKRSKLGPRTSKCVFLGYAFHSKSYRFLELDSNVIIESRDAEFFESNTIKNSNFSEASTSNNENNFENIVSENEENFEIRKSKRIRKEKNFGTDFLTYFIEGNSQVVVNEVGVCYNIENEPSNIEEAMKSRDATFWKEAIDDEMESIMFNNTWILVDLPSGSKPIGCKWIFKKKMKSDGSIDKYKARLVAKGYRQSKGIDYFDTYAPVARISSIRTLISLASIYNLEIHQMDVKTAFLNGYLDEEVYMEQPEGFIIPGQENKVCKLVRSLYGLKQAPKQWHERFDNVVISNGFRLNETDKCIYFKMFDSNIVIICLYVDDMLIFSNSISCIKDTKDFLSSHFDMKDMGIANTILGIKLHKIGNAYAISQTHYIDKVLNKFSHLHDKISRIPYNSSLKLGINKNRCVSQLEYSSIIGSLMYAMHWTRPDIAFAVGKLSRYTSCPSIEHWKAISIVLGYLKGTKSYALYYEGYPSVIEGYSDANWNCVDDGSKSTSGWVFTLGGAAIS
jgi:hypothetical protein